MRNEQTENKADLLSRVKAHPIVTALFLICVATAATAAFLKDVQSLKEEFENLIVSSKSTLELFVPNSNVSVLVDGVMEDGTEVAFTVGEEDKSSIFTELTKATVHKGTRYVFRIRNPGCENS